MSAAKPSGIEATIANHHVTDLGDDRFEATSLRAGAGRIYGGQAMAQALNAAGRTVGELFVLHSYHAYFLRAGDLASTIDIKVDRIRDGRSFSTRRVVLSQGGREIFTCVASYQVPEEGLEFQVDSPKKAVGPEGLVNDKTLITDYFSEQGVEYSFPIEVRQVEPVDLADPQLAGERALVWFKSGERFEAPQSVHQELLAYASDYPLLVTALRPHGLTHWSKGMQTASLDHALWFHRPVDMNEWLLYELQAVNTVGSRGFVTANIFNQQGLLVASVSQEGLLRYKA